MLKNALTGVFALAVALVVGQLVLPTPALATVTCGAGSFSGTDVDFTGVQETATTADPEPLFCSGAISVAGNTLTLFPTNFSAIASGLAGFDQTGSNLQAVIQSTSALTIDQLLITEFGDTDLSGTGTASTGHFLQMSGTVTVEEAFGAPITPEVINWSGIFTKAPPDPDAGDPAETLGLPTDQDVTIWKGSALIDVAAVVPGASKVTLAFNNKLTAFSETGTTATVQKKVGGPISITVIPEPTTLALLGGGVLAMGCLARFRRG
jgi:hypothetical protein